MNFKSLGSNTSLLIKIGIITTNNQCLPMRNKFVYFCSINIHAPGFNELLESIFCLLLVAEAFSPAKSCRDAWRQQAYKRVVGWQEVVRWIWQIRQIFIAQSVQLLNVGFTTRSWALSWKLGWFCCPTPAAGAAVFSVSHWFAEHTSQM